jgi:Kef-type K+ transport system membrane component KefB
LFKNESLLWRVREYLKISIVLDFFVLFPLILSLYSSELFVFTLFLGVLLGFAFSYFTLKVNLKKINEKGELKSKYNDLPITIYAYSSIIVMWVPKIISQNFVNLSTFITFGIPVLMLISLTTAIPTYLAVKYRLLKMWQQKNQKEIVYKTDSILSTKINAAPQNP